MTAARRSAPIVIWEPRSKPQEALLACPVFEVFFGGARGSLKTDGMLGDWASHADLYGKDANGLMVRRKRTELVDTIKRSKQIYTALGAKYHEQDKLWRFPGGAEFRFAYLENDSDAESYQGHSYTRIYVEEVGNFPSSVPVMKLMATLRSTAGVPVGFRATGNPGGPGHQWVKARYIDPAPLGWKIIEDEYKNPFTGETVKKQRVFIPGRITDHTLLGNEYVATLQMSGSQQLVKAWLEGDWSIIEGAFFSEFSAGRHVVNPIALPSHWTRFRAMDWGSAKPFSVGWYAVSDGTPIPRVMDGRRDDLLIPRGAIVKYREWYGMKDGHPNVGLKLTAEEVAQGIIDREAGDSITYGVIDPSAYAFNGGPSIVERMDKEWQALGASGVWRPADNARVAGNGAMGGWDQLRARLKGDEYGPGLLFFSTCTHTIRTLPALQHDQSNAEDVDTDGEDHAPDETRYACMSRPYIREAPRPKGQIDMRTPTMNDLWANRFKPQRHERI